jgi:hypothetical protein
MNVTIAQMNQDSWGQFIDIEQNVVYIPTNNEIQILYLITSLSLFQIFMLFIIFEYLLFG